MDVSIAKLVGQCVVLFLGLALALFLAAGTSAWAAGWVFLLLYSSFVLGVSFWLLRHNPELLQERMRGFRSDQNAWDKVVLLASGVLFVAWMILMPLDAV